jgi:hypothetical protein
MASTRFPAPEDDPSPEIARTAADEVRDLLARLLAEREAERAIAELLAPQPGPRPPIGRFTLMDLGPDTCRFPFGDGPFLFCGAEPLPEKPYCATCIRGLYRSLDEAEEALEE